MADTNRSILRLSALNKYASASTPSVKEASDRSMIRHAVLQKAAAIDNLGTEVAGTLLAPFIGAGAGGIIGALSQAGKNSTLMDPHPMRTGAAAGALVGMGTGHAANLLGPLVATIVKRRTRKEQVKHDSKTHLESLIPGVGSYNYTKRLGRALAGTGETDEQLNSDKASS